MTTRNPQSGRWVALDQASPKVSSAGGRRYRISGRIVRISTGGATSENLHADIAGVGDSRESAGDHRLRALLRTAATLRANGTPESLARRKRIWEEIVAGEYARVKQMVSVRGFAQSGSAWVNRGDVDDVTMDALVRATRMAQGFKGSTPGELHNALKTCVQFAVADYVRREERRPEVPVDPTRFDPGANDPDGLSPLPMDVVVEAAFDGSHDELMEALGQIAELEPRARQVVAMRTSGHSSAEIAVELALNAANVDQIYSRTMRTLRNKSRREDER